MRFVMDHLDLHYLHLWHTSKYDIYLAAERAELRETDDKNELDDQNKLMKIKYKILLA